MQRSDRDLRQSRASLLAGVPARTSPDGRGSLLASPAARDEDAAERHAEARARREWKPSLLLAAPRATAGDANVAPPAPAREPSFPVEPPAAPAPVARRGGGGRWIVLGTTLAGALAGAALWLAWPKTYVATSEMLIDPDALRPAAAVAAPLSPDAAFALVDNQLRVLRSGPALNAAVERLNLAADPEFNGADAGPFGIGGALAGFGELVAGDGGSAMERRRRQVVEALGRALRVERIGGSSVVAVSAATGDPRKSALIANTVSELFLAGAGGPGAAPERLRAEAEEAERAVAAFRAENGLGGDEEVTRIEEELAAVRARSAELGAQAASARGADVDAIVTGSVPERYASPTLADLRIRHADLKQQVDRISAKLGPRHPERLAAEAQLEGARRAIDGELRRAASALQADLQFAVRQEQDLAAQLARMKASRDGLGDRLATLRALEREAGDRRAAYERSLDLAQAGGAPSAGGVSVISRAEPPLRGQGPSLPAFTLAGAAIGFLAGVGFLGLRRSDDDEEDASAVHREPEHGYGETDWHDPAADAPPTAYPDAPEDAPDFEEAYEMHPYPPHAQPPAGAPAYAQAGPYGYDRAAPAPYPPAYPAWPPQHQQFMPPPPPPYDPWAHLRGYATPAAYHAAPPAYYYPPAYPAAHAPQHFAQRPVDDGYGQIDRRTDAAIEEIRWSLRELRAAIEDFAGSRASRRRHGS